MLNGKARIAGLLNPGSVHVNLAPPELIERALARKEGLLTDTGALVAYTGPRTGRSPKDRYLAADPESQASIDWGTVNRPMDPATFQRLYDKVRAYYQDRELFALDAAACADPRYQLPIRVITDKAWHALFAYCLFRRPAEPGATKEAPLTILAASGLHADSATDQTQSETFIVLNLAQRIVLIGGTHYAGEIKKSVFSYLNYLLPHQNVFPMHCSANIGDADDVALFFGLSGTGKTTLSADPQRRLIGDDEHGWSAEGVFNLEGGCYAKTIRLSATGEPQIYNAIRFGSVLENVVVDPQTRRPDYDSQHYTENTRAAYPIDYIEGSKPSGRGGHPKNVVFLTCDAFGVLPPLARLTPEQALYHFLSGYTAKAAGTEAGVTEPEATFSTCFAAPFLPLPPSRYAGLLHDRLKTHGSTVWLVNTGWTGGPYGQGRRMPLNQTRALLHAALSGALNQATWNPDPIFGIQVPSSCPGVPSEMLQPRKTWSDPLAYDAKARQLVERFRVNFEKYAATVSEAVRRAGPR